MSRIFRDYHIGRRCVRIFHRPRPAPQRPYFSTRYCLAFGAGPIGVMVMRTMTREEIEAENRRSLMALRRATHRTDRSESDADA